MARTYGLIGTRADLGGLVAEAQLRALSHESSATGTWGVGFFEKDEVLLKRAPGGTEDSGIVDQVSRVRSHAFLAHECDAKDGGPSPQSTPPLRYGHVLFSCHGVANTIETIVEGARSSLPEFLHRTVRGETLSEIAFALFLAELPSPSLARTRLREPRRSVDPLQPERLASALRTSLKKLDQLCDAHERERFRGDVWIHTGEVMMVAHREGHLGLRVLRGKDDLMQLELSQSAALTGIDHSHFVALTANARETPREWERIPGNILLTARRGELPETESL